MCCVASFVADGCVVPASGAVDRTQIDLKPQFVYATTTRVAATERPESSPGCSKPGRHYLGFRVPVVGWLSLWKNSDSILENPCLISL